MKISINNNSLQSPKCQNFGAIKIDNIQLLEKNKKDIYKSIKACFYELEPYCNKDIKLIKKIRKVWDKNTEYGNSICDSFLSKKDYTCKYFMLRTNNGIHKKITNLMQIDMDLANLKNPMLEVKYLQSAPYIANRAQPKIKGSGEIAIYEAAKIAKDGDWNSLVLFSSNNKFYEKIGMKKICDVYNLGLFQVTKENFTEFINKIKAKYKLK